MAANWNQQQVFAQLNSGRRWAGDSISYAFPQSAADMYTDDEGPGFRPLNAAQQNLVRLALATWDDLVTQSIVPTNPGRSDLEFGYTDTGIGYAHAYFPQNGSVYFNAGQGSLVNAAVGAYGFQTFIHEVGHALGLNHMGDYNGNGNWAPSSYQDSVVLSIMSYFGPRLAAPNYSAEVMQADWVAADGNTYSPQTPMLNDVMAIQAIYGTSTTTRLGDTTYGFNSNVGGATAQLHDFTRNPQPILTLFDSGGNDTLDLSGWSTPSQIDLAPGTFSHANAMSHNIAIAGNTLIENALGGGGNDRIQGNDAANRLSGNGGDDELLGGGGDDSLVGGPGNDLIDGGTGSDTAIFGAPFSSFTVNVSGTTVTFTSPQTGTDRVSNVERFQFQDLTRTLAELSPDGSDRTPPVVLTLSPADDAAGVAVGTNLVLNLSETVKAGTGSVGIYQTDGSLLRSIGIGDATQVRFTGSSVTIDPSIDLAAGRGYYVTVSAGAITDLAGNAFAGIDGATRWNFTTAEAVDRTPPRIVALSPADDGTDVAANANLVLSFDEPVRAASGSFTLRSGAQVLEVIPIANVSITGGTVTIDPVAALPAGTEVHVTLDSGALVDAVGNAFAGISSNTSWNFRVAAAAAADDYPASPATTGVVTVGGAASRGVIEVGGDRDFFRVELVVGQSVTFTLERVAGGLADPLLGLFDADGRLVAEDDDSAGSGNARIAYTVPRSGSYYLDARDFSASGTGAYLLRATLEDSQAPQLLSRTPADEASGVPVASNITLAFSETVVAGNGSIRLLGEGSRLLREIRASDTAAVRIEGRNVSIDPGESLPAGTDLQVVIDANAFRDTAGNAFAGVTAAAGWNFRTAAPATGDDYPMDTDAAGLLTVGTAGIEARIDSAEDGDLFKVALTAGVTYRFDLVSPAMSRVDPYLVLYDRLPLVELIDYDDDGGPLPLDSRLYFTPTESGTYFLAAFDYAEETGSYRISASAPADDYLGSTATSGRVTVGGAGTSGAIDVPRDRDLFAVTLTAGQPYAFDLRASNLEDPYLTLLDATGRTLAQDDDGAGGLDSRVHFVAPTTGTYYLAATDFDTGTGTYRLSGTALQALRGTALPDELRGGPAAEALIGQAGDDLLQGGGGDDWLLGGDGIDTARWVGTIDGFVGERGADGWMLDDRFGGEGRDLLQGIERVQFADASLALDLEGHAGTVAKVLGVVFGPESVTDPELVGIGLAVVDSGINGPALMQLALDARLGAGASAGLVVELLWFNLFFELPSAPNRLFYEGLITRGEISAANLALLAAETEYNLINIDLIGLADTGLPYFPYDFG